MEPSAMTLNMCSCLPHTRQPSARPLEAASSEPSIIMQANRILAPRVLFPNSRHVLAPDLCLAAPPTTQPVATHSRPDVFSCPSSRLRRIMLAEIVDYAFTDAHIMLRILHNYALGSLRTITGTIQGIFGSVYPECTKPSDTGITG